MNLSDLIKSNNWLSIELTLLRLYPDQEKMLDEYRNVFEKLRITEPEEYDLEIVLNEYDCDPNFENDKKTYIDVSERKKVADPNSLTDSYAIEFVEWKNWLGMDLAPQTIKRFTDLEIIVHCLYEMTFVGYDEEEIQGQRNSLNDRVEEYQNMTEEEKKEKTISLDELLKRFDENEGSS